MPQQKQTEIPNQRLQNKMSHAEYHERYDLDEIGIFTEQTKQLNNFETANMMLAVLFKFIDVKTWAEFIAFMQKADKETPHFKDHITKKLYQNTSEPQEND